MIAMYPGGGAAVHATEGAPVRAAGRRWRYLTIAHTLPERRGGSGGIVAKSAIARIGSGIAPKSAIAEIGSGVAPESAIAGIRSGVAPKSTIAGIRSSIASESIVTGIGSGVPKTA